MGGGKIKMSGYLFFKITASPKSMKNPEIKNPQYIPSLPEHMLLNISETILKYRQINPIINRIIPIITISYQLLIVGKNILPYPFSIHQYNKSNSFLKQFWEWN